MERYNGDAGRPLEAVFMEFTINCPIDGVIEVSLEDIDNVVLRESDRADITFVCPHCGTEINVTAVVPSFLMAAIEALADDVDASAGGMVMFSAETEDGEAITIAVESEPVAERTDERSERNHEAYCEYFRRQLDRIDTVEDLLSEIDSASGS